MPNADSDINTFLAFTNCTDGHPLENITQLVPLVQSSEDETAYISTQPSSFYGDWGISFHDKWENLLKVDSLTDAGKMTWVQSCNPEKECQALMDSFNNLDFHGDNKI